MSTLYIIVFAVRHPGDALDFGYGWCRGQAFIKLGRAKADKVNNIFITDVADKQIIVDQENYFILLHVKSIADQ